MDNMLRLCTPPSPYPEWPEHEWNPHTDTKGPVTDLEVETAGLRAFAGYYISGEWRVDRERVWRETQWGPDGTDIPGWMYLKHLASDEGPGHQEMIGWMKVIENDLGCEPAAVSLYRRLMAFEHPYGMFEANRNLAHCMKDKTGSGGHARQHDNWTGYLMNNCKDSQGALENWENVQALSPMPKRSGGGGGQRQTDRERWRQEWEDEEHDGATSASSWGFDHGFVQPHGGRVPGPYARGHAGPPPPPPKNGPPQQQYFDGPGRNLA